MSDDIFRDIWDKLAVISRQIGAAVQVAKVGGAQGVQQSPTGMFAKAGSVIAGAVQKVQAAFAKLPMSMLKFAGIAAIATAAVTGLIKAVHSATAAQLEQQRELTKVNATIARSFALADFADFMRNVRRGQATSGTTSRLNDAFGKLKDALVPMQAAWTNAVNKILIALTKFVTPIVNLLSRIVTPIIDAVGALADLPDRIYYAIADALKTEDQKRQAERDRAQQALRDGQSDQIPVARMFSGMLRKDWAAVTDSRKPLF